MLDETFQELVRVEKPTPESEVRNVPKSRLSSGKMSEFGKTVIQKKPDDVHVAITPCADTSEVSCIASMRLEAGVPIFDREEEPFGMVVIEGDFDRLVGSQLRNRNRVSGQVLVIGSDETVLFEDSERTQGAVGKKATDLVPSWTDIKRDLELNTDYIDSQRAIFATCVCLVPRIASLNIVVTASEE